MHVTSKINIFFDFVKCNYTELWLHLGGYNVTDYNTPLKAMSVSKSTIEFSGQFKQKWENLIVCVLYFWWC